MRETLSPIASRVDFAESGKLALQRIDAYAYSVIFLDAMLPDDDAYEICGRIKKHPLQQQASTVMLTCNSSPAERVMGMLAGFDNFLAKPIRRDGSANWRPSSVGRVRPSEARASPPCTAAVQSIAQQRAAPIVYLDDCLQQET